MALVTPDFTEVQEKKTVAPGTYTAMIKKAEVKAWDSGEQYVNWLLEVTGDPDPKNNGAGVFTKTNLTGKGAFRLQNLYKAATGETVKGPFDTDMLLTRKVKIVVEQQVNRQTGQPTEYVEVTKFLPAH